MMKENELSVPIKKSVKKTDKSRTEGLGEISNLKKLKGVEVFLPGFVNFFIKFSPVKIFYFTFFLKEPWNQLDLRTIQKPKVLGFGVFLIN